MRSRPCETTNHHCDWRCRGTRPDSISVSPALAARGLGEATDAGGSQPSIDTEIAAARCVRKDDDLGTDRPFPVIARATGESASERQPSRLDGSTHSWTEARRPINRNQESIRRGSGPDGWMWATVAEPSSSAAGAG